jgi:formylglycine-generating enzyme required for sulfatase activity
MASRPGGDFIMGAVKMKPDAASMPHFHPVAPFYLDVVEVTYGQYKQFAKTPSRYIEQLKLSDKDAVRNVLWITAIMCAESFGKRLPWEDEWEFAATNGGNYRYPWGNEWIFKSWDLGPSGMPAEDVTKMEPKIYGLYSNVGEWTMSRMHEYPGVDMQIHKVFEEDPVMRGGLKGLVTVRGAPSRALRGEQPNEEMLTQLLAKQLLDARNRVWHSPYVRMPGLGFRCARSVKPPFVSPR